MTILVCWNGLYKIRLQLRTSANSFPDRMTVMPLNLLLEIILKHIANHPNVNILFSHKVLSLTQTFQTATLTVEVTRHNIPYTKTFTANYILACDGGSSTIRKLVFGPHHWPGMTWTLSLVVQNVRYPGFSEHGWGGAHYLILQERPGLIVERGKGGYLAGYVGRS